MAFENNDVTIDSPVNNFATINPIGGQYQSYHDISNGNLKFTNSTYANTVDYANYLVPSICFGMDMSFYFEVLMPNLGDSSGNFVGIFQIETRNPTLQYGRPQGDGATHNAVYNWSNFAGGGTKESIIRKNISGETRYSSISDLLTSTVQGLFYNAVDKTFSYYYDGVLQFSVDISMFDENYPLTPIFKSHLGEVRLNFGQDQTFGGAKTDGGGYTDANGIGQFNYSTAFDNGALALCTKSIPSGPIDVHADDVPADYFKAVTYSGSIGSDQLVDCGFPADFIWIKGRTAPFTTYHQLYDTLRGKNLYNSISKPR